MADPKTEARKKARAVRAEVKALRQQYPTLCLSIIAAQLGISVVSVKMIIGKNG